MYGRTRSDLRESTRRSRDGVEWTSDRLTFTFDEQAYGSASRADVAQAGGTWVWDKSFYLLLDLAVGGNFPGAPNAAAPWPQTLTVDWVRVYQ